MKAVCITGNRPHKMPFPEDSEECRQLKRRIKDTVLGLISEGYRHFISGMALGADTYFAECIIQLKTEYGITFEAAVPYPGQSGAYSPRDKKRYADVLQKADKTTVVCERYTPYCFFQRNRYMVDSSDVVLTVCYSGAGGAGYTAEYARQKNKRIINLIN